MKLPPPPVTRAESPAIIAVKRVIEPMSAHNPGKSDATVVINLMSLLELAPAVISFRETELRGPKRPKGYLFLKYRVGRPF